MNISSLKSVQVIEDNPRYWEVIGSALAVGWLEIVVSIFLKFGTFICRILSSCCLLLKT